MTYFRLLHVRLADGNDADQIRKGCRPAVVLQRGVQDPMQALPRVNRVCRWRFLGWNVHAFSFRVLRQLVHFIVQTAQRMARPSNLHHGRVRPDTTPRRVHTRQWEFITVHKTVQVVRHRHAFILEGLGVHKAIRFWAECASRCRGTTPGLCTVTCSHFSHIACLVLRYDIGR